MEHLIPHTIYVHEYEQEVPTIALLRKERDALMAVVGAYGAMPIDYRVVTGGKGRTSDLYLAAHDRLREVVRAIEVLTEEGAA